ncbi:hypothetical protein L6452_22496 [Arctium lappa]|uniref:Uncharacterized protein n=1 Tax=Arctium lappa TaxID=4217 RepID=A0ACB9B0B2_ARCLA|nr:hypothetical protein L6452_22496 [Arctium lappa]
MIATFIQISYYGYDIASMYKIIYYYYYYYYWLLLHIVIYSSCAFSTETEMQVFGFCNENERESSKARVISYYRVSRRFVKMVTMEQESRGE